MSQINPIVTDILEHHGTKNRVPDFTIKLTRNATGHISSVEIIELDENGVALTHTGVKGMKWGVRKNESSSSPSAVTVTQRKPGGKITVSGGKHHPVSADAASAASSHQKAKASSTHALSNHELQGLVKRLQLEQQYKQLSASKKSNGRKFLEKFLGNKQYRDQAVSNITETNAAKTVGAALTIGDSIRRTDLSGIGK